MSTAVVTGANGFIGRHLCGELVRLGWHVRVITRGAAPASPEKLAVAMASDCPELEQSLAGADVVFNLAGIAHESLAQADPEALLAVNVDAAMRVLRAADRVAVPQLVWLSSIKVLGDVSDRPLRPNDPYRPGDAYARSKVRAEQVLQDYPARATHLAVVRPPLVYGAGVGGNFLRLLRWVDKGVPLPLATASAPRSMVGIGNLCDLLCRLSEPNAGIFHVADERDLSVAELIGVLSDALDRPCRLWPMPQQLLHAVARLAGRAATYSRLFDPLQVDQTHTAAALGWRPPYPNLAQLQATAAWFQQQQ